jgi:hypothetical protein
MRPFISKVMKLARPGRQIPRREEPSGGILRKCPRSCPYFAPAFQRRSKAVPPNPGALFRPPVYMTFGILLTSTVVGTAEAMLAEYLAQSRKAVAIMSGKEIGTFQPQRSSLAKPSLLSAQCRRKSAPRRVKFKRLPLPTSSRTSYAIEISQQRCICGRARILGHPADFDLARIFLDIIVATRHVTQSVHINTAEHGRARINLPLTNLSLSSTALSQH